MTILSGASVTFKCRKKDYPAGCGGIPPYIIGEKGIGRGREKRNGDFLSWKMWQDRGGTYRGRGKVSQVIKCLRYQLLLSPPLSLALSPPPSGPWGGTFNIKSRKLFDWRWHIITSLSLSLSLSGMPSFLIIPFLTFSLSLSFWLSSESQLYSSSTRLLIAYIDAWWLRIKFFCLAEKYILSYI